MKRPGTANLRFQGRAGMAYVPGPYDGDGDVIVAVEGGAPPARVGTRRWETIARRVRVRTVASSRVGLLTIELLALANRMRQCLG